MNSRDRVLIALDHEEPDQVPITDHMYMRKSLENVLGENGVTTDDSRRYLKACKTLGFDLITVFTSPPPFKPRSLDVEEEVDGWGRRWRVDKESDMLWYLGGPVKTREDYDRVRNRLVFPGDPGDMFVSAKKLVELTKGEYALAGMVDGPFTPSWEMMGFTEFCKSLYHDTSLVESLCGDFSRWNIEIGRRLIELGVDMIWIADDLGASTEPLVSPSMFRKHILPFLREEVNEFLIRDVKVILHSCGRVMQFMNDIIDTGIVGIHPLERSAGMNLKEMKDKYGDRLTLIGNVEGKSLIPYGSREEIKRDVLNCLKIGAPGGGYIFATDHSLHMGMPAEKIRYTFDLAKKYGEYPKKLVRHFDAAT